MGQTISSVTTCDGGEDDQSQNASGHRRRPNRNAWDEDADVSCAALEEAAKGVLASANRGGSKISNEVLLNHELLQCARSGDVKGVSAALEKGAWTETRRPLVMKPQKPERKNDSDHGDVGQDRSSSSNSKGGSSTSFFAA